MITKEEFQKLILQGIPDELPEPAVYEPEINHAPIRKQILTNDEKKLAIRNALRYFPAKFHKTLAPEFKNELETYGRIYMYRFRPKYKMFARDITWFPHKSTQAAAIMLMISNNLDYAVAQHPHELITYGGNGAVYEDNEHFKSGRDGGAAVCFVNEEGESVWSPNGGKLEYGLNVTGGVKLIGGNGGSVTSDHWMHNISNYTGDRNSTGSTLPLAAGTRLSVAMLSPLTGSSSKTLTL